MRRLVFALLPLAVILAAAEAYGRRLPDDPRHGLMQLYEPDSRFVREGEGGARGTMPGELRQQEWTVPAPGYRVAFVGDSTVWGQLPDALAQGLSVPGQAVEVLNFGMRGAGSDRARILAGQALEQDLDLLVVYVGHNEVTEARLNPIALRPFWERRVLSAAVRSGVARLLGDWMEPVKQRLVLPQGALRATRDAALAPLTEAEWAAIAPSYRRNLAAICEDAAGRAPLLLVVPVSSLLNPGEAPRAGSPDYDEALTAGQRALRDQDPVTALGYADMLVKSRPDHSPPRVLRGLALLALGRRDEALDDLRLARRIDAQPSRATEDHAAIVREVGAACGATVVETEAPFLDDPRMLTPGDPLFMDRVHPTAAGNVLLASIVAAAAPLPEGAGYDGTRVALQNHADDASRGWKIVTPAWSP